MRIQHNIMAMSAYRNYSNNVAAMQKNLEKLSSGYKINRAGDDAAGLAISEKMRAQITGLETAQKNAKDGISLVQTAEGALTEVHDMLNRMVELATQSANGTYENSTDRTQLQKELDQLRSEINRIADSSNFNGIQLLDGSMSELKETPITVDLMSAAALSGYKADTTVFGSIAAPASGTPASTGDTVLHESAPTPVAGEFTIALDHVSVAAGSSSSALKISLDGKTWATITGSATGALNGKTIARLLAGSKGAYVSIGTNGEAVFATATATTGNTLVYKATAGSDGTVTYKLHGYTNAGGTFTSASTDAALKGMDAGVAGALKSAAVDLDFTVSIGSVTGQLNDNRPNYGTINVKDTVISEGAKFGTANVALNIGNLGSDAANLKITIGAGTTAQTVTFRLSDAGESGSNVIDLRGLDTADQIRKIANELNAKASTTGIKVGVNGDGKLTLSETTDAQGSSTAPSDVQKAMESVEGFQSLLNAEVQKANPNTAGATLTVDPNRIYEGNTAEITVGSTTTKYVFTSDQSKLTATGSAVPANTKYVALGSNVVNNLAAAIGNGATANGNKITIGGEGSAAVTVASKVGWTGNAGLMLQIGDTAKSYNQLRVNINDCHTYAMGDGTTTIADISIATQEDALAAIDVIKSAVNYVSDVRGTLGATQNRLDHTINNLSVMTENIQDAESTIRDVDVAEEMMAYTKNNILIQSAQAMLAQANQVPQGVLQLLQ